MFFDDAFVPDSAVLGGVGAGWSVAMATTGSERGLTLRSPGRFLQAAENLRRLALEHPDRLDGRTRDGVVEAHLRAEAYQLFTLAQVSDLVEGRNPGAESSLNKIYWSELDIALHEAALSLLGPDAEGGRALDPGVTCFPCPDRSTPAPTRSNDPSSPSACSACRGSDPCVSPPPLTSSSSPAPSATCSTTPAAPDVVRAAWSPDETGSRPKLWAQLAELDLLGAAVPEVAVAAWA